MKGAKSHSLRKIGLHGWAGACALESAVVQQGSRLDSAPAQYRYEIPNTTIPCRLVSPRTSEGMLTRQPRSGRRVSLARCGGYSGLYNQ